MAMNWNVTNWAPNSYPQNYRSPSSWMAMAPPVAPPLPQVSGQAGPYFSMPYPSMTNPSPQFYPQQPVIQYIPVPVVPNNPTPSNPTPNNSIQAVKPASTAIETPKVPSTSISTINPFTENMPEPPSAKNPVSKPAETKPAEKPAPKTPQAYSDEFGQKLGALVTDLLKQHPEWEAELKRLDVDQYLISPDKMAQRLKDAVKKSRILRFALQHSKPNIIKAFPDNLEPMAKQFLDWLLEYRD